MVSKCFVLRCSNESTEMLRLRWAARSGLRGLLGLQRTSVRRLLLRVHVLPVPELLRLVLLLQAVSDLSELPLPLLRVLSALPAVRVLLQPVPQGLLGPLRPRRSGLLALEGRGSSREARRHPRVGVPQGRRDAGRSRFDRRQQDPGPAQAAGRLIVAAL